MTYRDRPGRATRRIVAGTLLGSDALGRHRRSRSSRACAIGFTTAGRRHRPLRHARPAHHGAVTSVRSVNWRDARTGGFMFVFRPGVLDRAPHGFVAPFRATGRDRSARAARARSRHRSFPTCRSSICERSSTRGGRSFAASRSACQHRRRPGPGHRDPDPQRRDSDDRFRRTYEAAILKTLGASTRLVGPPAARRVRVARPHRRHRGRPAAGLVLSWAISKWAIDVRWSAPWVEVVSELAMATVLVARPSDWSPALTFCGGAAGHPPGGVVYDSLFVTPARGVFEE